jgi:Tfp pilus assembly protein PilV
MNTTTAHLSVPAPGRRRPAAPLRGCTAFTIVEVMFAAAVMALAITTSITTMQHAFQALDTARKITLASQIMQSEFERMRLENWGEVNAYAPTEDITATINAKFSSFENAAAVTKSFTLTRSVSNINADMRQITLTAAWRSFDGRLSSRSYTTYYGKDGLYDYFYNSY